jgi:hypothetical protein
MVKPHPQIDIKNGAFQMKCIDCALKYIGQTGRTFYTTYKEHIQAITNNNSNSVIFESHIKYGTRIQEYNWYNENREKGKASEYIWELPYIYG